MSKRGVYISAGQAYYGGDDPAGIYATHRLQLLLDYLRGDDVAKAKVIEKVIDEELSKPRTHVRIYGLGSDPLS